MNTVQTTLEKAIVSHQKGNLDKAESLYRKILKDDKKNADAWHLLGVLFYQMGEWQIAIHNIQKAITLKSDEASFYSNIGLAYHQMRETGLALESYHRALELNPEYPQALNNLGNLLKDMGRKGSDEYDTALVCFKKALQFSPDYVDALNNLGILLIARDEEAEAPAYFEKALQCKPDYADAHGNLGLYYKEKGMLDKAFFHIQKALLLSGQSNPLLMSTLYEIKRDACDWAGLELLQAELIKRTLDPKDRTVTDPFVVISKFDQIDTKMQYRLIEAYSQYKLRGKNPCFEHRPEKKEKIRLGYMSADLYNHATLHLIGNLFAEHDRNRFEVTLFSLKHDKKDAYFKRAVAGVDRFVDLADLDDMSAASAIQAEAIDILIDLNGWTKDARGTILAYRPAPLQMQYLGFPGTTANPGIDYIIADSVVIPPETSRNYSESILYLPGSYQVNDSEQIISQQTKPKAAWGLPEEGFIFASFNLPHKIDPKTFAIWMEILREVEGSVLWLLATNPYAEDNLKKAANLHGIDPQRLVFAKKVSKADHLARLKSADLVLDTHFYNGHTTSSDALFAGVPVVSCRGETFASRVSTSLLYAVGMESCSVSNMDEYKKLAVALGKDRDRVRHLRKKLEKNSREMTLFDTTDFVRKMEKGLTMAWTRYLEKNMIGTITVEKEEA